MQYNHLPGRPKPWAQGELGDEAGLLLTEDDDWSDSARKSNDGDTSLGEAGRCVFGSGDDTIRFSELVRRTLFPGESDWLALRPKRFQNGLVLAGLSPVSGPGEGLGEIVPLLPRLKGSFFLTCLLADSARFRPPLLMEVLASSVALSITLAPPLRISSITSRWESPTTDCEEKKQHHHSVFFWCNFAKW